MKYTGVVLLAVLILVACVGCSTSSVAVGNARPPVDPSEVRVYLRPPAKYQEIALITSNNQFGSPFGEQAKVNTVINRMKNEAARLRANGILLQQIGDQSVGSVGSGIATLFSTGGSATAFGTGVSTNMLLKIGTAVAIYVSPAEKR